MEALRTLEEKILRGEEKRKQEQDRIGKAREFLEELKKLLNRYGKNIVIIKFKDGTEMFVNLHRDKIEINGKEVVIDRDYATLIHLSKQEVVEIR